jgi:hypothetical protein
MSLSVPGFEGRTTHTDHAAVRPASPSLFHQISLDFRPTNLRKKLSFSAAACFLRKENPKRYKQELERSFSEEGQVKQEDHARSDECAKRRCPILARSQLIKVHAKGDPGSDTIGYYEADEKPRQLDKRSDAHLPKKKGYTRCDDYSHKRCLIFIRGSPPMHQVYTTKNARGNAQGYHKANEKLY